MDKIKALMKKCGVRPELANRLCEGVQNYIAQERSRDQAELKQRQEEAKRVCLEEVDSYKRDLARRLQIFCEATGARIEQSVARQTAIKESAAQTKLRDILSLLEGVELPGGQNVDLQAENTKLKRQLAKLTESNKLAVETANRQSALAAKVLGQNRKLETQIQENRKNNGTPIAETRNGQRQVKRIDENRNRHQSGEPVTTRATLKENQDPTRRRPQPTTVSTEEYSPDAIAAGMETDLI